MQEPGCYLIGQGHSPHLNLCIDFSEICSCLAHNFCQHVETLKLFGRNDDY